MHSPLPTRVARTRGLLEALDELLQAGGHRATLSPERSHATPLVELFDRFSPETRLELRAPFARALHRIVRAQLDAFPENVFWDFDALAASLARQPDAATLAQTSATVVSLQALFGQATPIHFRYVHDFMYGFDWAKWVARDSDARASVAPFEQPFLNYTWRRGHELLLLIANDDEKYPKLSDGRPRNPFGFSREPAEEARLLRDLAARALIPVRAWLGDPAANWCPPYQRLREERAHALGIATE
jgi:hypothetical protein